MNRGIFLVAAAAIVLAVADSDALAREFGARAEAGEVGRYQLVRISDIHFFLIDTATGHCWRGRVDGDWRNEGNPTLIKPARITTTRPPAKLNLPEEAVEMIVIQREEKAIPGSEGSVRIRLGDITEGQVLLSVVNTDGDYLLERKSVSQGDKATFSLDGGKYTVHVKELHNILVGDDFAKITVAKASEASAP